MSATKLRTILLAGLMIVSAGCQTMPDPPTKPTLSAEEIDGRVCFSEADASKLAVYIIELEAGYESR